MKNKECNCNELIKKIDDMRWLLFGIEERIEKLEKNINIEYRDRIIALENWAQKILGNPVEYNRINRADNGSEIDKYVSLYDGELSEWYKKNKSDGHIGGYGSEFWGSNSLKYLKKVNPKSILDVGCGVGDFCNAVNKFVKTVYGLDIASVRTDKVKGKDKIKYIDSEIKRIPLDDDSIEWVTGFDVLEHIPEYDIDISLKELDRVSTKGMIFSITHDRCEYEGEIIHKTVKDREWWLDKLKKYGEVHLWGQTPYIDSKYIIVLKV